MNSVKSIWTPATCRLCRSSTLGRVVLHTGHTTQLNTIVLKWLCASIKFFVSDEHHCSNTTTEQQQTTRNCHDRCGQVTILVVRTYYWRLKNWYLPSWLIIVLTLYTTIYCAVMYRFIGFHHMKSHALLELTCTR